MDNVNASPGPDLIDSVVGLTPANELYTIRHGPRESASRHSRQL